MTDKRSVFDASCENIHRFLDDCVASEPSPGKLSRTARMEQWLQEQLAEKCPVSGSRGRSQSRLLERIEETVLQNMNGSVGQALSDPKVPVELVQAIKDRYKEWAGKEADKDKQRIHTAIYFAAIARALVSHNQTITHHPHDYLIHSFETLRGERWVSSPLRALYAEAKRLCESATRN